MTFIRPLLLGCDPELFLVDAEGKFRSAHRVVPGNKHNPHEVSFGAVQPDGTSAEFNIEPAESPEAFSANIKSVLRSLQSIVNEKEPTWTLRVAPTAVFEEEYFKALPGKALIFGCSPDFNAYTGKRNAFSGTKEPFRTGAGHVHVGWTLGEDVTDTGHLYDCREAVKQLDSALYFTSHLWDQDSKRRELYGKIGAFRPKPYGVEYRPLSNAWIADPDLHVFIYNTVVHAMDLLDLKGLPLYDQSWIGEAIDDVRLQADYHVSKNEALGIHRALVKEFGFPEIPAAYTDLGG